MKLEWKKPSWGDDWQPVVPVDNRIVGAFEATDASAITAHTPKGIILYRKAKQPPYEYTSSSMGGKWNPLDEVSAPVGELLESGIVEAVTLDTVQSVITYRKAGEDNG